MKTLVDLPEENFQLQFYSNRNRNLWKKLLWTLNRNEIIDICVALAPIDLPAYVLLEIIDWFPLFEYIQHKMKIDLIIRIKKSISKIVESKNQTITK